MPRQAVTRLTSSRSGALIRAGSCLAMLVIAVSLLGSPRGAFGAPPSQKPPGSLSIALSYGAGTRPRTGED